MCPILTALSRQFFETGTWSSCVMSSCALWDMERQCCGLKHPKEDKN